MVRLLMTPEQAIKHGRRIHNPSPVVLLPPEGKQNDSGAIVEGQNSESEVKSVVSVTEKPLIEFRSPSELKAYKPPEGQLLVGDYHIVRGQSFVIGGAPGVGKSRSSVDLAVAGAVIRDFFGMPVHRGFKTMIVQTENSETRLSMEFAKLSCDAIDDFIRICPPPPFGLPFRRSDFREQLTEAIAAFAPDLVEFDPWNAVAQRQQQEDYLEAFELLNCVLPQGDAAPALGIVAHTRKPRPDERLNGRALLNLLVGSYALGAVPRTVFILQAGSDDTEDKHVVWTCCKNNNGAELGPRSAWEHRDGLFLPAHDFDWEAFSGGKTDKRQKVSEFDVAEVCTDWIRRADAISEIEKNCDVSNSTAQRALERCSGKLRGDGKGKLKWEPF
jgi:hypothetical protein